MNYGDSRLPEQFWERCIPEPNSGCWLWIGPISAGRPVFRGYMHTPYAHRVVYQVEHGEFARDVLPTCGADRLCCNPAHMRSERILIPEVRHRYKLEWQKQAIAGRPEVRERRRAVNRRMYAANPKIGERARLKAKYGITPEQVNHMLAEQNGSCAICGTVLEVGTRRMHIDHCHTTGIVRGLLCYGCNTGLGFFRDNASALANAIKYLADAKKKGAR